MAGGELDAFMGFSKEGTAQTDSGKVPEIQGETQDAFERDWAKNHKINNSIQIKSYELTFTSDHDHSEEQEDTSKKTAQRHYPEFGDVKVTKLFDSASPKLLEAVYYAARFRKVELWQRRAGASKDRAGGYFFWVVLLDVTVNSVNWTTSESSPYPEETITLGYQSIYVDYRPQTKSGSLDDSITTWDDSEYLSLLSAHGDKKAKAKKDGLGQLSDADLEPKVLAILKKHHVPFK